MTSKLILLEALIFLLSVHLSGGSNDVPEIKAIKSLDRVGFDLHSDSFYIKDLVDKQNLVYEAFKRTKFVSTQIYTAGFEGSTRKKESPSEPVYPFAVAQRSVHSFGSNSDRWDVKMGGQNYEFIALYHATSSDTFVADSLRANMLRLMVSGIKNYLPILDSTVDRLKEHAEVVKEEVKRLIGRVMREMDKRLRDLTFEDDNSSADGSILIITNSYVVVANLGAGKVLAYAESNSNSKSEAQIMELTDGVLVRTKKSNKQNVFGAKQMRKNACKSFVEIYPKELPAIKGFGAGIKMKYLFLESPSVAALVDHRDLKQIIQNQQTDNRDIGQSFYNRTVSSIIDLVESKSNILLRHQNPDHLVMLVSANKR